MLHCEDPNHIINCELEIWLSGCHDIIIDTTTVTGYISGSRPAAPVISCYFINSSLSNCQKYDKMSWIWPCPAWKWPELPVGMSTKYIAKPVATCMTMYKTFHDIHFSIN